MTVSVIIPWQHAEGRVEQLDWVLEQYELHHADWQVVLAELGTHETWSKAAAVDVGLEAAEGSLLLIADADVWCDPGPAIDALTTVRWAVPHRLVHRLTRQATELVLAGADWHGLPLEQLPYGGHLGGGMVALRRDTYLDCPLDPRFTGWGQEDDAWGEALGTLAGPCQRFNGPETDLVHLWHPHPDRLTRRNGNEDGIALARRYHLAAGAGRRDATVMRTLVDEHTGRYREVTA